MRLITLICFTLLLVLGIGLLAEAAAQEQDETPPDGDDNGDDATVHVEISSQCAAALIGTGALLGAGAAYALTPAAMCTAGFCSAGIAKGSFAAWWQSTMPLVASGSLFAQLQSLAMASAGMGKITIAAGAIGGLTGVSYLEHFCAFVDDTDPNSSTGKVIAASVVAGKAVVKGKEFMKDQCAASESCTAVVEATLEAAASASKFAQEKANEAKEHLESQCASSELCKAGAEVGTAVKNFASVLWKTIVQEAETFVDKDGRVPS